jgi:hypothetical protein
MNPARAVSRVAMITRVFPRRHALVGSNAGEFFNALEALASDPDGEVKRAAEFINLRGAGFAPGRVSRIVWGARVSSALLAGNPPLLGIEQFLQNKYGDQAHLPFVGIVSAIIGLSHFLELDLEPAAEGRCIQSAPSTVARRQNDDELTVSKPMWIILHDGTTIIPPKSSNGVGDISV